MSITFEGYERRIDKINACLKEFGIKDLEEAKALAQKSEFIKKHLPESIINIYCK